MVFEETESSLLPAHRLQTYNIWAVLTMAAAIFRWAFVKKWFHQQSFVCVWSPCRKAVISGYSGGPLLDLVQAGRLVNQHVEDFGDWEIMVIMQVLFGCIFVQNQRCTMITSRSWHRFVFASMSSPPAKSILFSSQVSGEPCLAPQQLWAPWLIMFEHVKKKSKLSLGTESNFNKPRAFFCQMTPGPN